jgi:putative ABC transport system permease protein
VTSRLRTPHLLVRHLSSGLGGSILVAALVGLAVLAVALAPRALATLGTAELRDEGGSHSPLLVDLTGSGELGLPGRLEADGEALLAPTAGFVPLLDDDFAAPLSDVAGEPIWVARATGADVAATPARPGLVLTLAIDPGWRDRIRLVDGVLPAAWSGPAAGGDAQGAPLEIAVSARTAAAASLEVGDDVVLPDADARIVGVYEPVDEGDSYWAHVSDLDAPLIDIEPGRPPIVRAGAYVHPGSVAELTDEFRSGQLALWITLDIARLEFESADALQLQLRQVLAARIGLPYGGSVTFESGFPDLIDEVRGRVTAVSALLALCVSGLVGVLVAALALGVRAVLARRAAALALTAARGASGLQRRGAVALEGLLLGVPVSAVAVGIAALLLPGEMTPSGWAAPALLALAPAALFAALASPANLRGPRSDLRMRGSRRGRGLAELAVVGLAVVAVVLLARRGLVASSEVVGIDPLLSATPLLLALAGCLGALRLYPLPLLAAQRGLRRRRGAAHLLGAARAARDPALGFATALALVVGMSIVVFSTVLATTVAAALERGARDLVGADVQLSAVAIDAETLAAITAVDGVRDVASLTIASGIPFTDASDELDVFLVVADTAALHAVRPDLPALGDGADGRVPVLASADWASRIEPPATLGDLDIEVAGTVPSSALPGVATRWLLIDAAAAVELGVELPQPERVLVTLEPGADSSTVAAALTDLVRAGQPPGLGGVVVGRDVAAALEAARTPVIRALEGSLALAAVVSLLLASLTVVLASASVAAARNRLIGVLRVLGMSARQIRGVLAWELGPLAIVAIVVGTALGLVLPWIVTGVLDLRPFVGGREPPGVVVDPLLVAVAVAAFAVVVAGAALVAGALGRRLAPAGALKMGES